MGRNSNKTKRNVNSDSENKNQKPSLNGVMAVASNVDKSLLEEKQKTIKDQYDEIPFLTNEGLSQGSYSKTPVLSNDNSQFTNNNNYNLGGGVQTGITMPTSVTNLNLSDSANAYVNGDYSAYKEEGKPRHEAEYKQIAYDNLSDYDKQVVDARQKVVDAQEKVNQGGHVGFVAKRELEKAQNELERAVNASFVGENATEEEKNAIVKKWLDPNYKMTKGEREQAKQIVSDYEDANQFTNFNVQDHTAEEKQLADDMYSLRDKTSARERILQGIMGGIPFVDALQTKADTRAATTEWEENKGKDKNGNTVTKQEYIDQYNREHNTATAARENAETQSPLEYNAAKIGTLVAGSVVGGAALEGTAYGNALNAIGQKGPVYKILADSLKDAPIDVLTDIAPNLANDIAAGKDPDEVMSNLVKNVALNYGINLGVSGLQNIDAIKDIFKNGFPSSSKSVDEADSLFSKFGDRTMREISDDRQLAEAMANGADEAKAAREASRLDEIARLEEEAQAARYAEADDDLETGLRILSDREEAARYAEREAERVTSDYVNSDATTRRAFEREVERGKDVPIGKTTRNIDTNALSSTNRDVIPSLTDDSIPSGEFNKSRYRDFADSQGFKRYPEGLNVNGTDNGAKRIAELTDNDDVSALAEQVIRQNPGTEPIDAIKYAEDSLGVGDTTPDFIKTQYGDRSAYLANKSFSDREATELAYRYMREGMPEEEAMKKAASMYGIDDLTPYSDQIPKANAEYGIPYVDDFEEGRNEIPRFTTESTRHRVSDGYSLSNDGTNNVARKASETKNVSSSGLTPEEELEEQFRLTEQTDWQQPKKESGTSLSGNETIPSVVTSGSVNSPDVPSVQTSSANSVDIGSSKRITNTEVKIDPESAFEDMTKGIDEYVIKHEADTLRAASNRIATNGEEATRLSIMSIPDNAFTSEDVDASMMLLNRYKSMLNDAKQSGDANAIKDLTSKIDSLKRRQVQAASNAGQVSQAWAKWSRDADGAELAAISLQNKQYTDVLASDKRIADAIDRLDTSVKRSTRTARSSDDIASAIKKQASTNKTVADNLTDEVVTDYAERIYSRLKKGEGIDDLLEEIKHIGATGSSGSLSEEALTKIKAIGEKMEDMENEGIPYTSKARYELESEMYAIIADDINLHASFSDKVNAWRYFSMLANPKTHIRNVLGNTSFGGMTRIKDDVAAIIESAFLKEGSERTKTLLNPLDADVKQMRELARKNADEVYTMLVDGNKYYSGKHGIEANASVFKNKILNKLVNLNGNLLNYEDEVALYRKYSDSLVRYLKANGADSSIFKATDDEALELLSRAQEYAIGEAKKATFHQTSQLADVLSDASRKLAAGNNKDKAVGLVLDATIPFKKTPINIVKSAGAYSPLEVAKVVSDIPKVVKGTMTGAEMIDDVAKGLTGTGMLAGGFFLASSGILTAKDNSDGQQQYSIKLGNSSYTIDGFAPASIPLLLGASIYELMEASTNEEKWDDFLTAMIGVADPIIETTMLKGIGDMLKSGQTYNDEGDTSGLVKAGASIVSNYVGQFVPSELGNLERTIDDTRRSTYTGESGLPNMFDKAFLKNKNKIPGYGATSEASIDNWGEENKNVGGNFVGRLLYNHLSPGYYEKTDMSDRAVELRRLAKDTGDTNVLNEKYPSSSLTVNKESRKLTKEQYTQYSTEMGRMKAQLVDKFMASEQYQNLSDDNKAKIINDIYSVSSKYGTGKVFSDYSTDNTDYKTLIEDGPDALIKKMIGDTKITSTGASVSDKTRELLETGGEEAVQQYSDLNQTLKDNGFDVNESNRKILEKEGVAGLQKRKEVGDVLGTIQKGTDAFGSPTYFSLSDTGAVEVYNQMHSKQAVEDYADLKNSDSRDDQIAQLEDMNYSDEERGYLLAKSISGKSAAAKNLEKSGDYENFYLYYIAKQLADSDGNGSFNKKEKANFIPVLVANGYDEETARYMAQLWNIN